MEEPKDKDRRILQCLLCGGSFDQLPKHLSRKCMKDSNKEERDLAAEQARSSNKEFNRHGRLWSQAEMRELIPDENSRSLVMDKMRERGILFEEELPSFQPTPSTSRRAAPPQPSTSATSSGPQQDETVPLSDVSKFLGEAGLTMEELHPKIIANNATDTEMADFRQYCEAILMLKCFQKPLAVENFTVTEWEHGIKALPDGGPCVFRMSKQDAKTETAFVLSERDRLDFETYFHDIRPKNVSQLVANNDHFFLNSKGKTVSASYDLEAILKKFGCPKITTSALKKTLMERIAVLPDNETRNVKCYLKNSGKLTSTELFDTFKVLETLTGGADAEESVDDFRGHGPKSRTAFLKVFPVDDGDPPTAFALKSAGFEGKRFYQSWVYLQRNMRLEKAKKDAAEGSRRQPSRRRTLLLIDEKYKKNKPNVDAVLKGLETKRAKLEPDKDPTIIDFVKTQSWPTVYIKEAGVKGDGLFAATDIPKGHVVCDYHGEYLSHHEGKTRFEQQESPSYYFFQLPHHSGWIDAQSESCDCHPGKRSFGRKINHSKKKPNVKPFPYQMQLKDDDQSEKEHVLLFKALKDIKAHEELLFDYGVNQRSFGMEAAGYEWLNS